MLTIQNLKVEFGSRILFENLTFSVLPKERISFAGHNGAGKSTLMKCISGLLEPSSGEITTPKHCNIGYLPQEGIHIQGISLWDEAEKAFVEAKRIEREIEKLAEKLETLDSKSQDYLDLLHSIGELELKLEHFEPARIKPRIESILLGLGFKKQDFQRDCGEFSGGWQMRLAMAKLFLSKPEVLLLDEPTNHLDIDSQTWVENYLKNYAGAIILISHDLALLDTLTTRTIAFAHGRAEEYAGNYSFYLKESAARKEILRKQKKSQEKEIEKTKQFIDRFRAKASKATQAQSRLKQLEKIEVIELEEEDAVMHFTFPEPPSSGHSVAALENASKSYDDKIIFEHLNLEIERGERLAIVGPNGAGKSTFCRLITGQEQPTAGTHKLGHNVSISFFSQNHADELEPDKTVLETVEAVASKANAPIVRNILGCFLFKGDSVFKKIGVLSGGERSRVALVCMLVQPANFLILDEPTNHLDVQSQEVLQNALNSFPGSYLIVSHNRAFLDNIVNKTLEFRPQQDPKLYHGNVSYYLDKKAEEAEQEKANTVKKSSPSGNNAKLSRKEQRKKEAQQRQQRNQVLKPLQASLEKIETAIAETEAAQATLTEHMSQPEIAIDGDKMQQSLNAYQSLGKKLETYFSEWENVTEKIETLQEQLKEND